MRQLGRRLPILVLLLLSGAAASSQDWAGWRGPNRTLAVADPDGPRTGRGYRFRVVWKRSLGSGYSAISLSGGVAVTAFSDESSNYVGAFDAEDGRELWRFRMAPVFLGRFGSANGPISTPLIAEERVFVVDNSGTLFALDLSGGRELWRVDLTADLGATVPFYGFGTSPMSVSDSVIVQTGGEAGAISSFDAATGHVEWSAGSDGTDYQSPGLLTIDGEPHVVLVGNRELTGLDPETGRVLWSGAHGGRGGGNPIGVGSANLVTTAPNRALVKAADHSTLFELQARNGTYSLDELWRSRDLKLTYVVSVFHDGLLFGYNKQFLNCVDAETGERLWRSRQPGDGFPIVVNGHLLLITKQGTLSMARASREGYAEIASAKIFDDRVWTPPSYAGGHLYVRSLSEWARVEIADSSTGVRVDREVEGVLPDSGFERFAARVRETEPGRRRDLIDAFMAEQERFPIIEGDESVHFVYRGEAQDVGLSSDLFGGRTDRKMHRIEGTDFFYFSARLPSDARVNYSFVTDFEDAQPDPRNPRTPPFSPRSSELAMPGWVRPAHLSPAPAEVRGTLEKQALESRLQQTEIELTVYLPHNFSRERRYPVAFVLDADEDAVASIANTLDNLTGRSVEPIIAAFVPYFGPPYVPTYVEYVGDRLPAYLQVLMEEIVPFVDERYPTLTEASGRALIGAMNTTYTAVYTVFRFPGTFAKLGLQSMRWEPTLRPGNRRMLAEAPPQELTIYLDWGRYDGKSERELFDVRAFSLAFAEDLRAAGYSFTGGEVHDGSGPDSWRNRTDELLEALFPRRP